MPLKACYECGHMVSPMARACPNCGAPLKFGSGFRDLSVAIIVIGTVSGFVYLSAVRPQQPKVSKSAELPEAAVEPAGKLSAAIRAHSFVNTIAGDSADADTVRSLDVAPRRPFFASSDLTLKAEVRFDGVTLTIYNRDSWDWKNVRMVLNPPSDIFEEKGFIFQLAQIPANSVTTVGCRQFARKDGLRYDPLVYKPLRFSISCNYNPLNRPGSAEAFWTRAWGEPP